MSRIVEPVYPGIDSDSMRRAIETLGRNDIEMNQLDASVVLSFNDFRVGSTPPTIVAIGTSPAVPGWKFNATGELLSANVMMPNNWEKGFDCVLNLIWSLTTLEVDDDELSITCDYVAIKKETTGAGAAKTSTQLTPTLNVTTANGLADGDIYVMSMTFDKDDTNNGFSVGDKVVGFCFDFHLTNVTEIADVNFLGGSIDYVII